MLTLIIPNSSKCSNPLFVMIAKKGFGALGGVGIVGVRLCNHHVTPALQLGSPGMWFGRTRTCMCNFAVRTFVYTSCCQAVDGLKVENASQLATTCCEHSPSVDALVLVGRTSVQWLVIVAPACTFCTMSSECRLQRIWQGSMDINITHCVCACYLQLCSLPFRHTGRHGWLHAETRTIVMLWQSSCATSVTELVNV